MSKEEVLSYFYTNSTNYGIKSTFVIPLCSLVTGMIIYLTYYISAEKIVSSKTTGIWNRHLPVVTGGETPIDKDAFAEILKPYVVSQRIRTATPPGKKTYWVVESGEAVG